MNVYTTTFDARCPVNGDHVRYELRIETHCVIEAERINEAVDGMDWKLHERIADELIDAFRGRQTLTANHRGVTIETKRIK